MRSAIAMASLVVAAAASPRLCAALPGDAPPRRLVIPSIGVDAAVESVGLSAGGAMDTPRSAANVAWFNLGVAPGRPGNAVMAGHLDDRRGSPAVFWSLGEIQPGAEVLVVGADGATLRFRVSEVASYRTGATPMDYVFGPTGASRLNLITCTGTWSRSARSYSHRLVVFADLDGPGAPLPAPAALPTARPTEPDVTPSPSMAQPPPTVPSRSVPRPGRGRLPAILAARVQPAY